MLLSVSVEVPEMSFSEMKHVTVPAGKKDVLGLGLEEKIGTVGNNQAYCLRERERGQKD